ncbi:beta-glucosidase [Tessaracoccus rhinocerotis]|uniref:Exo-alpha-(1->6)-L-arabinopyranosidase n=1 Tax=Tessaracoccus rhinocerotis TaxID=1689449 RepID=A0A553JZ11_9ACTN|nr:glycoside hydrolase family 3 N-terminal domain-containing protein [Tessaracoccus rhinocerotis]TRY17706.1 beta-glucosidase [Tessaracoccus rhinocerotis]
MPHHSDPALPPKVRADLLLRELTPEQKLAQVSCYMPTDIADTSDFLSRHPHGVGHVSTLEVRRATSLADVVDFQRHLQEVVMKASGHGIPATFHMEGLSGAYLPGATSFPSGIARASSWDPDLERDVGRIVSRQERSVGITQTFAPVLDVGRDPRMGRHGETYGEDPTLAAALGVAFTQGIQEQTDEGLRSDAVAKHFLGFHHSEGGIHGAHCNIPDRLLLEVYGKPFQAAISLAGLRGIMPCYGSIGGEPVSASRHFLTEMLRGEMGFDGLVVSDYGAIGNLHSVQRVAESFAHAGLAAMTAGLDVELHFPQGFNRTLLGWFTDGTADPAILDQAVARVLESKFRMGIFDQPLACEASPSLSTPADRAVSLRAARESLVLLKNEGVLPLDQATPTVAVIGCHAVNPRFFFGGYSHVSMVEGALAARASMAGMTTGDGHTDVSDSMVPGTQIQSDGGPEFEGILDWQHPGIHSLVDELRLRMPAAAVDWAFGYPIAGADESGHAEALEVAGRADVVILTLGGKHGTSSIATMGEGIDATNINLPPCQEQLIGKLATLGKPMVGVHLDGRPISSDAAELYLDALVEAWNPAESGAEALVDLLLGDINPSGRLPVSVAQNAGQVPIYYNHPNGSAWHQGASIGFPEYVDSPHTPRFPFGHGLSYTEFSYADLEVSADAIPASGRVEVSLTVTNTGERDGSDVVQLYVRDVFASLSRPVLELAGFQRVELAAGASARVHFTLEASQLAFLDHHMKWFVEAGDFDVMVGASSRDLRLADTFTVTNSSHVEGRTRAFVAASGASPVA